MSSAQYSITLFYQQDHEVSYGASNDHEEKPTTKCKWPIKAWGVAIVRHTQARKTTTAVSTQVHTQVNFILPRNLLTWKTARYYPNGIGVPRLEMGSEALLGPGLGCNHKFHSSRRTKTGLKTNICYTGSKTRMGRGVLQNQIQSWP